MKKNYGSGVHKQEIDQQIGMNEFARLMTLEDPLAYRNSSAPVSLASGGETLSIPLTSPDGGWQATYLEATFSDGYVATT
ncbi:PhoPQ-activated pathogenicity-related protein [Serratia plymuthica]|nr:PhoPQ-activated pathogenicity-related protein [Serratia plymuthica]